MEGVPFSNCGTQLVHFAGQKIRGGKYAIVGFHSKMDTHTRRKNSSRKPQKLKKKLYKLNDRNFKIIYIFHLDFFIELNNVGMRR
jgi:hypothetical protein